MYFNKKSDMLLFLLAYNRNHISTNILSDFILRQIYYFIKNNEFTINDEIKDYIKLNDEYLFIATLYDFIIYSMKTRKEIFRVNINNIINQSHGNYDIMTNYPFDKMIRLTDSIIAFSMISYSHSVHILDINNLSVISSFNGHFGQKNIYILKKINDRLITSSKKKFFISYKISDFTNDPFLNTKIYYNHTSTPIECDSIGHNVFILDEYNNIKLYDDSTIDLIEKSSYILTDIIRTNIIAISSTKVLGIEAYHMFMIADILNKKVDYQIPSTKLVDSPIEIRKIIPNIIAIRNNNNRVQIWDISNSIFKCIKDIKYNENIRNMKVIDNKIIVQSTNKIKEYTY